MLSKQSIRKEVSIYLNGELLEKEEIIEISKEFTEKQEIRFRKMIKQGGNLKILGKLYEIKRNETLSMNNKGEKETPLKPLKPRKE